MWLLTASTLPAFAQNDFYTGRNPSAEKSINWVQCISVSSPTYCSSISGSVVVKFSAPGMTQARALCWQQPTNADPGSWGHDVVVAPAITLDAQGNGSFPFYADQFPNGPIIVRIQAKGDGNKQDLCQLQLFNRGGVVWDQGLPIAPPAAAQGMKLTFADDFKSPLSINSNGIGATYQSHKTGGGDFSGYPFSDNRGEMNPFSQIGNFLRIHASKNASGKSSTGLISSAHEDGTGIFVKAPCYLECRFLAQSAPGTWPAFWLLTDGCLSKDKSVSSEGCDELDVIEAYGGMGQHNPNFANYQVNSHFWNQPKPEWSVKGADGKAHYKNHGDIPMMDLGSRSSWSTTFHTYGIKITETDTTYYLDNIEVLRHPSGKLSRSQAFWFLINYAIGGASGWHIDLERYGNQSDMWVDYVRVYKGF